MKKSFKKKLTILTLISISLIACEPSPEKVQEYLSTNNYEQLYNYFQNATDKSISIVGYQDPTLFEKVMHSLIFNPSDYSAKTISRISPKSKNWALSITKVAIDSGYTIPDGLHDVIYTAYKDQRVVVIGKEKVEKLIKSDNGFRPVIIKELKEIVERSFSVNKIIQLAELGSIELPADLVSEIQRLPLEISELERKRTDSNYSLTDSERKRNSLTQNLNKITQSDDYKVVKAIMDRSYVFDGYMVAFLDDIPTGEVYEVRDMLRNVYLLNTVDTRFSSKGFFKLRVTKSDMDIPMTLKNGGFKKDIPLLVEVRNKIIEDYRAYESGVNILNLEIRSLDRKIDHRELDRKRRQLADQKKQYDIEIKNNAALLAEKKVELKVWIQKNLSD